MKSATVGTVVCTVNLGHQLAAFVDQHAARTTRGNRSLAIRNLIAVARDAMEEEGRPG